jgi:hypothetical protein
MRSPKFIFISIVVPTINGNHAKLLVVTEEEFEKIKEFTSLNFETNAKPYSMFVESNSRHQFLGNSGYLTKEQFTETLREFYNSIIVWKKNNKALKKA